MPLVSDLHTLANAISNQSPAIKRFAQAVADRLDPPTPPPPPVSGAWPANPWKPGVWNGPALPAAVKIDPHSSDYAANLVANMKGPVVATASYSVPVYVSSPSDKLYTVTAGNGVKSVQVRIPKGAKPAPGTDAHMVILDYSTGHEVGTYHTRYDAASDTWSADYMQVIPFDKVNTGGVPGANDANLPFTAGLLTPEHFTGAQPVMFPLAFVCNRGNGPIRWPSCMPGSPNSAGQYGPTNGMWMQLDPAYDVSQLPIQWERSIAVLLQQRGMVCRDGSPNLTLFAEDTATSGRKAPAYPWGSGNPSFSKAFPWNRMRVLAVPVPYQP